MPAESGYGGLKGEAGRTVKALSLNLPESGYREWRQEWAVWPPGIESRNFV